MSDTSPALTQFLEKTPFFGGLDAEELDRVAAMLVPHEVKAGAHVFEEGDTGRSMYIVHHGDLVVYRRGSSGASVKLMHLGVGDFFGETTLIEMQPRPVTVVASRDALLYELTNLSFYRLYHEDIKAYVLVLQNMNRELCRRLRKAESRVTQFADDAHDERTQIISIPRMATPVDRGK